LRIGIDGVNWLRKLINKEPYANATGMLITYEKTIQKCLDEMKLLDIIPFFGIQSCSYRSVSRDISFQK
jgi:hypothetical protein